MVALLAQRAAALALELQRFAETDALANVLWVRNSLKQLRRYAAALQHMDEMPANVRPDDDVSATLDGPALSAATEWLRRKFTDVDAVMGERRQEAQKHIAAHKLAKKDDGE